MQNVIFWNCITKGLKHLTKYTKILEKHLILGYDSAEVWWVWTHDQKVMGSNLVSSKMVLKPRQDLFQHPIWVHIKKNENIDCQKRTYQKNIFENIIQQIF